MITRLDLFERVVVVDILRGVVKVDKYLGIAVWQEAIDLMRMLDTFVVDEYLDKLIEGKTRNVGTKDHFA